MVNRLSPDERLARAREIGIIVDPQDEWLLSELTWRLSTKGYVEGTAYDGWWRKTVKLHHYIMGTPITKKIIVDHENRNKLDNRRQNLRYVDPFTSIQNNDHIDAAANIRVTRDGRYEVRIQRDGILHQVGTFVTEQEAIHARESWYARYNTVNQLQIGDGGRQTASDLR